MLGLEDWRADSFFTALHLKHLQKTYWKTKYSISFPRLRPFSGGIKPKVEMTDADLVQLICAYRLLDEDIELSISTRENAKFRDNIIHLGITSMSAESKTNQEAMLWNLNLWNNLKFQMNAPPMRYIIC